MKIKVKKIEFDNFFHQFVTKGRLKRASTEKANVNFAFIQAKDGVIKVSGRKITEKIMVRGILNGEILEEGEFLISDIAIFMSELKGLTGKDYEFTFGENIKVKCGKTFEFPYIVPPNISALVEKLNEWDVCHKKIDGKIVLESGGKSYDFKKWFSIKDSSELNSIPADLLDRTRIDSFNISAKSGRLIIDSKNLEDSRSYYNEDIEVESFNDQIFSLGDDFLPLMKSLKGQATFHTYTTTKGSLVIWVECPPLDWQITYKA